MKQLFPRELVSGSVKTQADLNAAFLKYPNLSRSYLQTALYEKGLRNWYERNWPKIFKFLDNDFVNRFKMEQEHSARAWEFQVSAVFIEKGLKLLEKTWDYGPDFCILTSEGKKIWVEAIACKLPGDGSVQNHPMISGVAVTINIEHDHPPRALRITSAINEKFKKYKEYLKNSKSGVSKNDSLVIAINGEAVGQFTLPKILFKWAVFGQDPDMYVRVEGKEKLQGPFYKPISTLPKTSNVDIPARFLELDESKIISAVLYSGNNAFHHLLNDYNPGDDFLFAYHTNPENPIPVNTFRFGTGLYKDSTSQQIKDIEQT